MRHDRHLKPGHLLTGEERFQLRVIAQDLRRQIERANPWDRPRLETQLENVERERANDRQCRPRGSRK